MKPDVTYEDLRKHLHYDPDTGIFTRMFIESDNERMRRTHMSRYAGKPAGTISKIHGYQLISVKNKRYLGHRLAWMYVSGTWPPQDVDHINGIRSDNRFANLRLATRAQNLWNREKLPGNRSGYKGVRLHNKSGLWQVRFMRHGVEYSVGYFKDLEEAAAAYTTAVKQHDGDFFREPRKLKR